MSGITSACVGHGSRPAKNTGKASGIIVLNALAVGTASSIGPLIVPQSSHGKCSPVAAAQATFICASSSSTDFTVPHMSMAGAERRKLDPHPHHSVCWCDLGEGGPENFDKIEPVLLARSGRSDIPGDVRIARRIHHTSFGTQRDETGREAPGPFTIPLSTRKPAPTKTLAQSPSGTGAPEDFTKITQISRNTRQNRQRGA